jgi:anaerobic nitric oxide reductase flavorubredoxin
MNHKIKLKNMSKQVKNNIFWVGKTDWEIKRFHGQEYSTQRGTSYNSYLIKEEKTVLIDTVWQKFAKEYVENLKKEIDLKKIDYIVANHAEIDHSGALGELMKLMPDTPIYCTQAGVNSLKGHFHQDWNFQPIKTGDKLDLGNGKELVFIEAPMLHWPDSMFCYLAGDAVLFPNDAFGQHFASEHLFNDQVDAEELSQEAIKYYANILTPFSVFARQKIKQFQELGLPLSMICPSHGVIWRENPAQIIEKYLEWAGDYQEDQITIAYDTMWDGTRVMAENIATGIRQANKDIRIKLYNCAKMDKNDLITEIFKSKAILFGSPTINRGILHSLSGLLEMVKGLGFKNKKAAAFGSYGWSGEGVKEIEERISQSGLELITPGLKILWNPNDEQKEKCVLFGQKIAESL